MERKEHPVATISAGGNVLKLVDPDGNPYTPPEPVDYQILDEDGEVLKEGTIKDTDEIPLDDVSAKSFRVMIDSHLVLDTKGFESPVEDEDQKTVEGPSFDPDQASDIDELLPNTEDQKGEGEDSDSGTDDDDNSGDNSGDDSSGEEHDSSSGGGEDDEGSKDSDNESSDSDGNDASDSGSEDSKDSDDQDGDDNNDEDDDKTTANEDSDDSDEKASDADDQ